MTADGYPRLERRTSVRIAPKGSVTVTTAEGTHHGRVANLSSDGVLVAVLAPVGAMAETVSVELRLDGARGEWLSLSGRVVRSDDDTIAIAFLDAPHELGTLVSNLAHGANLQERRLSVVLVDATTLRRQQLAEAFRAAGCNVIDVETPLAAIAELGGADFEPDLIAIADSTGGIADDLRAFVRNAHPGVKLVRIGDDVIEPVGLAHWLSTANPNDDLLSRIYRLLGAHR